jgi:hypothetical protein
MDYRIGWTISGLIGAKVFGYPCPRFAQFSENIKRILQLLKKINYFPIDIAFELH